MTDDKVIVTMLSDLKHRVFPRPFERLGVTGRRLVGVEIGVHKGEHAESLLSHLDIKTLYLVDPYAMYAEYEESRSHYGDDASLDLAKAEAIGRLAPNAGKISWGFKRSGDAAAEIPDGIDFVYVDGDHEEHSVRADIASFYPKVRSGGVIGGHDVYNGFTRQHDGVVRAVSQFAVRNDLTLQVELPDWWIQKP